MNAVAYRAIVAQLKLAPGVVARLFGVDRHTSARWASGASRVPYAVALLLLALRDGYLSPDDLETLGRCGVPAQSEDA